MGPPLSHRETRRSGRRSAPSVSKSVSKSPETELPPPKQKDKETTVSRPPLSSSHSSSRGKKPKQEELDDNIEEQKSGSISSNSTASGRSKRKTGTKEKQTTVDPQPPSEDDAGPQAPEQEDEEEQGVTRCVCGSTGEDDPDAGEFMVQCEGCKVWQHGLCMGFESEDQLPDDDYYCEECDPDRHKDRLSKRRSRRPRQTSTTATSHINAVNNRVSRSHSPSSLRQPSKRRNTMNSRDAAFDESLKEVLEATAAEAAAQDIVSGMSNDLRSDQGGVEEDNDNASNKKKRKRVDEETTSKKRTRSASTASDQPPSAVVEEEPPEPPKSMPPPKSTSRTNKRGGKKAPPPLSIENASADGEEGTSSFFCNPKRTTQSRSKSAQKSAQISSQGGANQEIGSRRGQGTPNNAGTPAASTENTRGYRSINSTQHSLFTSWGLPDYLAHLEPILPSNVPPPLEVRSNSTGLTAGKGDNGEMSVERGVKVKWPSKRMSVGDMNKRVRALVEWVGREQASALDRIRRQDALNRALQGDIPAQNVISTEPAQDTNVAQNDVGELGTNGKLNPEMNRGLADVQSSATMKMMEELMEELIGFQERFGPGSKNRERRIVSN